MRRAESGTPKYPSWYKPYAWYVDRIQKATGLDRQGVAELIGIDPSVLSKRYSGRDVRYEGMVTISIVHDLVTQFEPGGANPGSRRYAEALGRALGGNPVLKTFVSQRKAAA